MRSLALRPDSTREPALGHGATLADVRATTSSVIRIPILDLTRGVAVVSVFLFHIYGASFARDALVWQGWVRGFNETLPFLLLLPLGFGWIGVPLFFVVSGFCIHLNRIKDSGAGWHVFFTRRFFQIPGISCRWRDQL
jgi:peptidoglycan/LPS O-acetylase OafA/YrhL